MRLLAEASTTLARIRASRRLWPAPGAPLASSWAACWDDLLAGVAGRCSIGPPDLSRNGPGPGPPVRGEGRLVDRRIKVQALGRGARVQSLAETAVASDRFRSRALVGGEMDRVTQRLHIDKVVLLVMRSGPGSAPGQPIQDHLQLITLLSSAHAAAPSDGAESMIEADVSATGASPVDSPFERSRNHPPQCRSARNSARRYRWSQSRSATARSPRSSSRIRSRNRYG